MSRTMTDAVLQRGDAEMLEMKCCIITVANDAQQDAFQIKLFKMSLLCLSDFDLPTLGVISLSAAAECNSAVQ